MVNLHGDSRPNDRVTAAAVRCMGEFNWPRRKTAIP
jgi:hypothetical protein